MAINISFDKLQMDSGYVPTDDRDVVNRGFLSTILPTGAIVHYAGATAPVGWLLCDGAEVSRSTYAPLFAVIGTSYGVGDASTTFNLPDIRGRVTMGLDNMGGTSADLVADAQADQVGGVMGAEGHVLTVAELASHVHGITTRSGLGAQAGTDPLGWISGGGPANNTSSIQNAGGDQAHNNMQPTIAGNFIIRT